MFLHCLKSETRIRNVYWKALPSTEYGNIDIDNTSNCSSLCNTSHHTTGQTTCYVEFWIVTHTHTYIRSFTDWIRFPREILSNVKTRRYPRRQSNSERRNNLFGFNIYVPGFTYLKIAVIVLIGIGAAVIVIDLVIFVWIGIVNPFMIWKRIIQWTPDWHSFGDTLSKDMLYRE